MSRTRILIALLAAVALFIAVELVRDRLDPRPLRVTVPPVIERPAGLDPRLPYPPPLFTVTPFVYPGPTIPLSAPTSTLTPPLAATPLPRLTPTPSPTALPPPSTPSPRP